MSDWELIKTNDLPLEDYAPTAIAIGDTIYFAASSGEEKPIFKSHDPFSGKWDIARESFPFPIWDPAFFLDDDNRLYLYWGCSNQNPIYAVELDYNNNFEPLGEIVECFNSDTENHGWERPGDYNELSQAPWIEGPWMNKLHGKYYLQYSGPGTEFKSYADGVYISNHPLGPFEYATHNPFSLKAGGFANGAGHGNTFADKFGNLWHSATISISVRFKFERRIALFPVYFGEDEILRANTSFGDFPHIIPDYKFEMDESLFTDWNLLSYGKQVIASSAIDSLPVHNLVDEDIRTFWAAENRDTNEWLQLDLGNIMEVNALQLNFYDYNSNLSSRRDDIYYQFIVESSEDGENWEIIIDNSETKNDKPHFYHSFPMCVNARYLKLTNLYFPSGNFCMSDFRVFGHGSGPIPEEVEEIKIERKEDKTIAHLFWKGADGASGYNIRYGIDPEKMYFSELVFGKTSLILRSLDANMDYFFSIAAINENGIGEGSEIYNTYIE